MSDWLIILLIFLAVLLILYILRYIKISTNNKFDLAKYERKGMSLKAYKEKYYPLFIEGIKDPELEATLDDIAKDNNITRDELDKIMRDTNTMTGQFEDWHIPEQQKDE